MRRHPAAFRRRGVVHGVSYYVRRNRRGESDPSTVRPTRGPQLLKVLGGTAHLPPPAIADERWIRIIPLRCSAGRLSGCAPSDGGQSDLSTRDASVASPDRTGCSPDRAEPRKCRRAAPRAPYMDARSSSGRFSPAIIGRILFRRTLHRIAIARLPRRRHWACSCDATKRLPHVPGPAGDLPMRADPRRRSRQKKGQPSCGPARRVGQRDPTARRGDRLGDRLMTANIRCGRLCTRA